MSTEELSSNSAVPLVLCLIKEKPMYGYQIIKAVNERSAGQFQEKEGSLYPCLHRMEGEGLLISEWSQNEAQRKHKYYRISRRGSALIKANMSSWSNLTSSIYNLLLSPQPA